MAASIAETGEARSRARRRWAALGVATLGWFILATIGHWRERHALLINSSASLPHWAFLIDRDGEPRRGSFVFFTPPAGPLVRRHFGNRPPLFGKIVYGAPGDLVSHEMGRVHINGISVGRMKSRSRWGEPLTAGATGVIPSGCVYAGSTHPDGFDSRYAEIGLICRERILGTGTAIL